MILLRHAQSHFNVHFSATRIDPGIVDPGLTTEGIGQAKAAAAGLRGAEIVKVLTSPYTRTLETAEIIADALDVPVIIEPLVRERCFFVCDIGSPRVRLVTRWPRFDFGDLPERWWPEPEETEAELLLRCSRFRDAMAIAEGWHQLLVVSHWAFIRGLTGQELHNAASLRFDPTAT